MTADYASQKIHPLPLVSEGKKELPGKIDNFMHYGYQTFTGKKKISYNGVLFLEESSDFLNNRLDQKELKEASRTLNSGIEELGKYEIRDPAMASKHSFDGYMDAFLGVGTFHGNVDEQKPSAYHAFFIGGKDKKDYENFLDDTLAKSYSHIKSGFKTKEDDKKFNVLTNAMASSEKMDPSQIIAINDYLRLIEKTSNSATHAYKAFKNYGLDDMHVPEFRNASRRRKAEILAERNYHLLSRPKEFLSKELFLQATIGTLSLVGSIFVPIGVYHVSKNPVAAIASIVPIASAGVYSCFGTHPGMRQEDILLAEILAEKNGDW